MAYSLKNEKNEFVQFYTEAVHMPFKSEQAGRPVYEEKVHIRKVVPGDKNTIIEREAFGKDFENYPQAYKAFQDSDDNIVGTPLSRWGLINKAQVKEAEHFNVRTVEQLSRLSDAHVQSLGMGFADLRSRALHYLSGEAAVAPVLPSVSEPEVPQRAKPGPKPKVSDDAA